MSSIKLNPLHEALIKAESAGMKGEELDELKKRLGIGNDIFPIEPVVESRDFKGSKPVTTLKTINDEQMSTEAALPAFGNLSTDAQHRANEAIEKEIKSKGESKG